jgi:hypothetical protein
MDKQQYEALLAQREEELRATEQKLNVAQHGYLLMTKAFDALLLHGVNFRKLRSWELWTKFLAHGEEHHEGHKHRTVLEWVQKVGNDIDAAVRRKFIKEVK